MAEFPERIPQHRHCRECGKAFVGDGYFCGDECKVSAGAVAKKKIRKLFLAWIAIVAVTVVIVVAFFFAGAL
jgi:predicted nucleic acid-binding Zn ribbon protein